MKISTRARYGTRALLDLALNANGAIIQLKDIAARQALSPSYLEHLFIPLIAAGLVKSTRGSRGGVALARPAPEIRLREIVEALEGPTFIVDCLTGSGECPRSGACATQDIWEELNEAIGGILDKTTLADLVERQRLKVKGPQMSYDI
jgi:Rrf2 family transcriptional regulator, cysteine metabolism repressor